MDYSTKFPRTKVYKKGFVVYAKDGKGYGLAYTAKAARRMLKSTKGGSCEVWPVNMMVTAYRAGADQ